MILDGVFGAAGASGVAGWIGWVVEGPHHEMTVWNWVVVAGAALVGAAVGVVVDD